MKPEKTQVAALSAVLTEDLAAIARLNGQLDELLPGLAVPVPGFKELASAAYVLHNVYNALENSFEQISRTFENHVVDQAQWHRELLQKMFLEIPTVRPAVFPAKLRSLLNDLRSFRHVFRHSYDLELRADLLGRLVRNWLAERDSVLGALGHFRDHLLSQIRG